MAALFVMPQLRQGLDHTPTVTPLESRLAIHIDVAFRAMLDPDRIAALAEDLGVIQRRRIYHAGLAVCAWILSAFERGTDTEGRQLDARRTYEQLGGRRGKKTAWRDHSLKLLPVFHTLLRRATRRWLERSPTALRGRLAAFSNVLIPDGCAFKLASALCGVYKGTGQPAEFKLHAIYSVRHGSATQVATSAGSVHDTDGLPDGPWEPGALYLWDLAYNDYGRFLSAAEAEAHVVQRLKDKANPVVLASYGPTGHRRAITWENGTPVQLDDACAMAMVHQQSVLDLDLELHAPGHAKRVVRAVCVPCNGVERWYLTTLPREIFSPQDVAEIYRVRWEVELFFRHWKGAVRLDEVRRLSDPEALEVAVLASLLASLLSQEIHAELEGLAAEEAELERLAIDSELATPPAPDAAAFPPRTPRARRVRKARPPRSSRAVARVV
jgi:putative transposase